MIDPKTTTRNNFLLPEGSPSLLQKSIEVGREFAQSQMAEIAFKMSKVAFNTNALGVAALQIGVNRRLIVAKLNGIYTFMINPKISYRGTKCVEQPEGCLSLSDCFLVTRVANSYTFSTLHFETMNFDLMK